MKYSQDFKNFLKDVISILKDNIRDLKEKRMFADDNEKDYIAARLFSYHEIISSIKSQLSEYNISEEEIGLNEIDDVLGAK
ncbi:MAG: hypothetical protein K2X86_12030 [Cytophagaceae bacterium]|nr:hypothetical protein [Cytophagaceae bacterium]